MNIIKVWIQVKLVIQTLLPVVGTGWLLFAVLRKFLEGTDWYWDRYYDHKIIDVLRGQIGVSVGSNVPAAISSGPIFSTVYSWTPLERVIEVSHSWPTLVRWALRRLKRKGRVLERKKEWKFVR